MSKRWSGLQLQAFALYRRALRSIRDKPEATRNDFSQLARSEFEQHRNVSPKNLQQVEHLLRKGQKQLDLMSRPEVQRVVLPGRKSP